MKKIVVILFLIQALFIKAQNDNSLFIDSLKQALKISGSDTQKIFILSHIIDGIQDDYIWIDFNREMFDLANKNISNNPHDERSKQIFFKSKSDALSNFGTYYDNKGETDSAIFYYMQAIDIDRKLNNKVSLAESLESAGKNLNVLGDYNKALQFYNEALIIALEEKNPKTLSRIYNSLGLLYRLQKDNATALLYYNKALAIRTKLHDKFGIGEVYINIAGIEPDLRKKLAYYQKSLAIMKISGHKIAIASVLNNIGSTYLELNKADTAFIYFNNALKIRKEVDDKTGMAKSLTSIARILFDNKNYDESLKLLTEAYELSLIIKNPELKIIITSKLKDIYFLKKDYLNAYKMLAICSSAKDSSFNINKGKEFYRQKLRFEYEHQEIVRKEEEARKEAEFKAKSRQQKIIIFSFLFIVIIISVFSYFLFSRYKLTQQQKRIIEKQKNEVDIKQKEILDSIHYAKRIQTTLLAHKDFIDENVPNNFVLFKPKDIVSGDFYWAGKKNERFYFAVCDSTGHGVPGAFMSLLNISFLNEAINEKNILEPNKILNHVRNQLNLNMDGGYDGMDAILICIDKSSGGITYAAANNQPILISNSKLIELPKDKMPVGRGERIDSFLLQTINAKKGDVLYLYTDGYADQFGGPKEKKFKYKQLNDLLSFISSDTMEEQKQKLEVAFESWKGSLEQIDDICIIGIKI
ncbi:MAG: tetratricopeptide repeat protein [Bacteroidia bacterium]